MKSLSSTRKSVRVHLLVGLSVACVLILGVGGWAAVTPLSGAVVAPGSLVVDSSTKPVQHPTGGIVAEVLVRDGDRVEAGAVLARLDSTEAQTNLAIIENRIVELSGREARLIAERDGEGQIVFLTTVVDHHDAAFSQDIIASETRLLQSRRDIRESQVSQLNERITQYENEITGLRAQQSGLARQIELVEGELVGIRILRADGNVSLTRLNTLERELANLQSEMGVVVATVARLEGQITETRLQSLAIDSELQNEVGQELSQVRAELSELFQRRVAALEQMRRVDIRAPQAGIVHDLAVHVAGAVIGEGAPLMYIVPVEDNLVVEVNIQPQDIDQLHLGQPTNMRFSAFNQRTTPELQGQISRIGADLSFDEASGMTFYTVRIDVGDQEIARLGGLALVPGMPVEAFIETEQRTAMSYLVKPLSDQIARAFREE